MSYSYSDQALSLAGLLQATTLVDQVANTGKADQADIEPIISSLFSLEPETAASVYGGPQRLRLGLQVLLEQLGRQRPKNIIARASAATYYAFAAMQLEKLLDAQPDLTRRLLENLRRLQHTANHLGPTHEEIVTELAEIYQRTAGEAGPRITVRGNPVHLRETKNAALIRMLLLGAVRSARLWRQCGGSRFGLLLNRRRLIEATRQLQGTLGDTTH